MSTTPLGDPTCYPQCKLANGQCDFSSASQTTSDAFVNLSRESKKIYLGSVLRDTTPNVVTCKQGVGPQCNAALWSPSWRTWIMLGSVIFILVASVVGIAFALHRRSTAVKKYMIVKTGSHPTTGEAVPLSSTSAANQAKFGSQDEWANHVASTRQSLYRQTGAV